MIGWSLPFSALTPLYLLNVGVVIIAVADNTDTHHIR